MEKNLRKLKKPDYRKLAGLVDDDRDYWEVDRAVTKRIKVSCKYIRHDSQSVSVRSYI